MLTLTFAIAIHKITQHFSYGYFKIDFQFSTATGCSVISNLTIIKEYIKVLFNMGGNVIFSL